MTECKDIQTIEDVRRWVKAHPDSYIAAAWSDMLFDMDEFGEEYTVRDFLEEVALAVVRGKVDPEELLAIRKTSEGYGAP